MVAPQARDEWVFLSGRPPIGEYLGFVQLNAANKDDIDMQALSNEWRTANDRVQQLVASEPNWADNPPITELPETVRHLAPRVVEDPMFQKSFPFVPASIGMVELDRLIVYQKHINITYTNELKTRLGTNPTDEDVFKLCLPIEHPIPPMRVTRVADNSYLFASPSIDIRFLEAMDAEAAHVTGYIPRGPGNKVVGIVVGYGSNYLHAIHANNRLLLTNGSHRAYALRDAGITHVPCIVLSIRQREELELTCPAVASNPEQYLVSPRPAVLKDYFDPQLRKSLEVWRKWRQVKVTFGIEVHDVAAF